MLLAIENRSGARPPCSEPLASDKEGDCQPADWNCCTSGACGPVVAVTWPEAGAITGVGGTAGACA